MIKENTPYRVKPLYQINWRYYIVKIKDEYFVIDYINPRNILSVFLIGGKSHYKMYRIGKNLNSDLLEYHELNWLVRNYHKIGNLLLTILTSGVIISYFGVRSDGLRNLVPLIFGVEGLIFLIWWVSLMLNSNNKKDALSKFEEYNAKPSSLKDYSKLKLLYIYTFGYLFLYLCIIICNGWFVFFPNWLTLLMIQIPYTWGALVGVYASINDVFVLSSNRKKLMLRKLN
ncbi:hypothetical protein [Limosilactobacillus equigenerosi]|uniref:Tandem five-TM protein n=1 Tax=Limosilactobacillus equigenerosi DSM 18793 = JCM 14505 TaxID=1423742 RepID=A0A0R1UGI3_9LACO|nr:hypothetical protein [Limosilactobacillus equigenerosi]KRL92518.1 hypothetical protein FC21_GL000238 [Limosilactobacillus equigenerosi DSM 18793 = JCM 14505]